MTVAEIENDALAVRAHAREQLTTAIIALGEARERLVQAKSAVRIATDRGIELLHKIDAAKEQLDFMKAGRASAADSVIAALLRGDAMQAERSPAEKVQAEIKDLEATRDQLRHARETAEREIEERKSAVGLAEMRVRRMAAAVLRSSGASARLLAGLMDLEREVVERRLGLRFLLAQDGVPESEKMAVQQLLAATALPTSADRADFFGWSRHPTTTAWAAALSTLERDADARLPD